MSCNSMSFRAFARRNALFSVTFESSLGFSRFRLNSPKRYNFSHPWVRVSILQSLPGSSLCRSMPCSAGTSKQLGCSASDPFQIRGVGAAERARVGRGDGAPDGIAASRRTRAGRVRFPAPRRTSTASMPVGACRAFMIACRLLSAPTFAAHRAAKAIIPERHRRDAACGRSHARPWQVALSCSRSRSRSNEFARRVASALRRVARHHGG